MDGMMIISLGRKLLKLIDANIIFFAKYLKHGK